jgi:hypothetical protein
MLPAPATPSGAAGIRLGAHSRFYLRYGDRPALKLHREGCYDDARLGQQRYGGNQTERRNCERCSRMQAPDSLCSDAAIGIIAYLFSFPRVHEAHHEWNDFAGKIGASRSSLK